MEVRGVVPWGLGLLDLFASVFSAESGVTQWCRIPFRFDTHWREGYLLGHRLGKRTPDDLALELSFLYSFKITLVGRSLNVAKGARG